MLLFLLLAAATSNSPGVGSTPAVTCIKTTIKANGHTSENSIAMPSGNIESDRYALKLVRALKLERERGKTYEPRTGYALIETYENGAFGMSLIDHKGQLLESCSEPQVQASGT